MSPEGQKRYRPRFEWELPAALLLVLVLYALSDRLGLGPFRYGPLILFVLLAAWRFVRRARGASSKSGKT